RQDCSLWLAVASRGSPCIISAVIQTLTNVIAHEMDIQEAIDAPRIHHQWLPDQMLHDPYGLSPDTINILRRFGHNVSDSTMNIAQATGIMIDDEGVRLGAIDSRGDGEAVGY